MIDFILAISKLSKSELQQRQENLIFYRDKVDRVILHWIEVGIQEGEKARDQWRKESAEAGMQIQLIEEAIKCLKK